MYTIIVYWNSTRFTRYEHKSPNSFSFTDGWLMIDIGPGHVLRIPSSTINRVETIEENS